MPDLRSFTEASKTEKLAHYASSLQALKDLTDLGNADANTSQDYAGRFAFELIQNAADAYDKASRRDSARYPRGQGRVTLALAQGWLVVANTGIPFSRHPDPEDRADISSLESISRLGESTKRSGEYIGNKGIGFRSIYQICNRLWLISGGFQICYDGQRTWTELKRLISQLENGDSGACLDYLNRCDGRIPMLKVGFWFELDDLPGEVAQIVRQLREGGYDTVLVLEQVKGLASPGVDPAFIWERLSSLSDKEILFLDTLSEVHCHNYDDPGQSFSYYLIRDGDQCIIRRKPDGHEWRYLTFHLPIPDLNQQAQIAFQTDSEGRPLPVAGADRVFYTFYPAAREEHGLPFYIHTYFMLNPNREYFNSESTEYIKRNKRLLDTLVEQLVQEVVPALRSRFPDLFLPGLLLPRLDDARTERLAGLRRHGEPSIEMLSRVGGLSAWFIHRLLSELAEEPLVPDLKGDFYPIGEILRCPDMTSAPAADVIFSVLDGLPVKKNLPPHLTCQNSLLMAAIANLEDYFANTRLDLNSLASAVACIGTSGEFTSREAAALVILLSKLSTRDPAETARAVERIRLARVRVLPCKGDRNVQPMPPIPEQGKLTRASAEAPLVFYSPSATEAQTDDLPEDGDQQKHVSIGIPHFCHVHVLEDEVLDSFSELGPDQMRTILRERLGLRPFWPEDIFVRIAESTLGTRDHEVALLWDQHRQLLETTLQLVSRQRLRGAVLNRRYEFRPWYLKERNDSDWKLYYYLARSFIPVGNQWIRASQVILAGRLGKHGEEARPAYLTTPQVLMTEDDEAEWLVELLNRYHDESTALTSPSEDELGAERLQFRSYVYRLLGAWNGLRLELIHHAEGPLSPASDPSLNPHTCISTKEWEAYISSSESPWTSYSLSRCKLVQSAAIPYLDQISTDEESWPCLIASLETSLPTVRKAARVLVYSPGNNPGEIPSYLLRQLQSLPWVDVESRDHLIPPGSRLWFTRQDIPARTGERLSAHYLMSVTARQISEDLARAIDMPVLEEASPEHLGDFVVLYKQLCDRIGETPAPGPGFLALYRMVVSKIQQLIIGTERLTEERVRKARETHGSWLGRIIKAGIIVIRNDNEVGTGRLSLQMDPSSIYYDDTGAQNAVFRDLMSLAAFDDTSQGMARLLGLRLLGRTEIQYDDGRDSTFAGHEDIEGEVESAMKELCAPLLAFRCFATFIPEGQRLTAGEERFNVRLEAFSNLKVEVVPKLRVSIDGAPPVDLSNDFHVVLEHKERQSRAKRLFVHESLLTSDGRVPLRVLARPLAGILGAEAQTIAVEMLLTQYANGGLKAVQSYLEEQCGVSRDQMREIEDLDEGSADARRRLLDELEAAVLRAMSNAYPDLHVDEHTREALRDRIEKALSLESPEVISYLQDTMKLELHRLADAIGLKPSRANLHRFALLKSQFRQKALVLVARATGTSGPGDDLRTLEPSYNAINMPRETAFRWQPGDAELLEPLRRWLGSVGAHPAHLDGAVLTPEELSVWRDLCPVGVEDVGDSETALAIVNVYIPWLIALAKDSTELPLGDLVDALDEQGLQEAVTGGESSGEILERFREFLNRYHVPIVRIEALFSLWPQGVAIEGTGLTIAMMEEVRLRIEQYRQDQKRRSRSQVHKYRQHIRELLGQDQGFSSPTPIHLSAKPQQEPAVPPEREGGEPPTHEPRKVRRHAVSEDDYVAADFEKRVVGECGENYALEVQRLRWESVLRETPESFPKLMAESKAHYDLDGADTEWIQRWSIIEQMDPGKWSPNEHWPILRSLLHMAEWSPMAGYDIVGLDRNSEEEGWSVFRIEVKATRGKNRLDFPTSRGELKEASREGETYAIWRVLNVAQGRKPWFFRLPNPVRMIEEGTLQATAEVTILKPALQD